MGLADPITVDEVNDPITLARYIQRTTGTPYPRNKDIAVLRKWCKKFFEEYPHLDYRVLCRTADWCKTKKRRFATVPAVLSQFRYAYSNGYLDDLVQESNRDDELEQKIDEAIAVEEDQQWRYRLLGAEGIRARKEVYNTWLQHRNAQFVAA